LKKQISVIPFEKVDEELKLGFNAFVIIPDNQIEANEISIYIYFILAQQISSSPVVILEGVDQLLVELDQTEACLIEPCNLYLHWQWLLRLFFSIFLSNSIGGILARLLLCI
jgi:hypothetical protein